MLLCKAKCWSYEKRMEGSSEKTPWQAHIISTGSIKPGIVLGLRKRNRPKQDRVRGWIKRRKGTHEAVPGNAQRLSVQNLILTKYSNSIAAFHMGHFFRTLQYSLYEKRR